MNSGWIPLWRKSLQNEVRRFDHTAWYVFETLLMLCDHDSGTWKGGRKQLAAICGLNHNTTYSAIKRLKKHKMITLSSNTNYSTISICNLDKYSINGNTKRQHASNTPATRQQHSNNNKEIINNKNTRPVSNETARSIYLFYLEQFNQSEARYKLSEARKLKLNARLRDAGPEQLKKAISAVAASPFHMGDNDRGWKADLDFIIRSYEQVERFANEQTENKELNVEEALSKL